MKLNEKSLSKYASSGAPPDKEGMLLKRGELNKGYQKRWFVLKGNVLFYYEKRMDKDPLGAIILEGCTIELSDENDGFTFMIHFPGSGCRTYIMCADTQEDMESWMKVLACASYDYMKMCVGELQTQLAEMDSETNKKLFKKVMDDSRAISSVSPEAKKSYISTADQLRVSSRSTRTNHRFNPFDSRDSTERDSFESGESSGSDKRSRTFVEMHEDFGAQIKEIMAGWLAGTKTKAGIVRNSII